MKWDFSFSFRGIYILLHPTQLHTRPGSVCQRLLLDRASRCGGWRRPPASAFPAPAQVSALRSAGLRRHHVHTCPGMGVHGLHSAHLRTQLPPSRIDNCYHRAAEGRAPKIEKQIQSKGPGITERERREIIENAEKEKSPEQNLFEKYLERRGQSNFLAKLYLARHLAIICLSSIPITYLSTYYALQRQNEFTCALGEPPDTSSIAELRLNVNCKLPAVQLQRIMAAVDILCCVL